MRLVRITLHFVALLSALGCAGGVERQLLSDVDGVIAEGRPQEAATFLAERGRAAYGERNRLLFHMDIGMALHLAGDYRRSAAQFEKADQLAADLYTRSLSSEAGALVTNDLLTPYAGEEFEIVLINVFAALDYLLLGEVEEALVEVRRIDVHLRAYRDRTTGRYRADGFALYLSGLLYEMAGAIDDARIAYTNAYDAYALGAKTFGTIPPQALARDVVRMSQMVGLDATAEMVAIAGANTAGPSGELIVLHYFGPGPRKRERVIEVSLSRGMAMVQAMEVRSDEDKSLQQSLSAVKGVAFDNQVTVAYPVFEQPPMAATQASVRVAGCGESMSAQVMDISRLAQVNLEDRMERDLGRLVSRAVLKFVSARVAGELAESLTNNSGLGALVKMLSQGAASATEAADIRGWRTLPATIHMIRINCPDGLFPVEVLHYGGQNTTTRHSFQVEIRDGQKSFIVVSSY